MNEARISFMTTHFNISEYFAKAIEEYYTIDYGVPEGPILEARAWLHVNCFCKALEIPFDFTKEYFLTALKNT